MWAAAPQDAVSYSLRSPSVAPPLTWRLDFPDSLAVAGSLLAEKAHAVSLAQRDLGRTAEILNLFDVNSVSFSTADDLLAPKTDLLTALEALRQPVAYGVPRGPAAVKKEDRLAMQQWQAFVAQVQRMISNYAYIQTAVAGVDMGLTKVGWSGDFSTTWSSAAPPLALTLHQKSVSTVLASRLALLRLVSVVASGAVGLAVKATLPGGQVALIPAVWRFVRTVLGEFKKSWPALKGQG